MDRADGDGASIRPCVREMSHVTSDIRPAPASRRLARTPAHCAYSRGRMRRRNGYRGDDFL
jgi:hypothetical protein